MTALAAPVTPRQVRARLALLAAGIVSVLVVSALVVAWLAPAGPHPWRIEYPLADLEVGVPREFRPEGLPPDSSGRPSRLLLVRHRDGTVDAFWSVTSHHRDCPVAVRKAAHDGRSGSFLAQYVPPDAESNWLFRTPCLGSTFTLDGMRVFGPAPRGLDSFPAHIERDQVVIDLTRLQLGACSGTVYEECSTPDQPRVVPIRWGKVR
jgi:hypothetical protein